MFGNRKNKIKEQVREIFAQINHHREDFEARMSSVEERSKQIQEEISQVAENTKSMTEYTTQNVQEGSALLHSMDTFSEDFDIAMAEYQKIVELVNENYEAVMKLVEENKYYTTSSKYLTEVPAKFRQDYKGYESKADALAENARQMSVQAVNAAVEAGRMGESGKSFVAVSEELRQMALEYEQSALSMKEELQASQEKVKELEENVSRLVSLIKDGNVGATRLMKKYMALQKAVEKSSMRAFSEDATLMRDKVVAIRNLEEEMLKTSERNKIQLTDIQEDLQNQEKELKELESDLSYIFEDAIERFIRKDLLMLK